MQKEKQMTATDRSHEIRHFSWNAIGSVIYSLSSFLYLMAAKRVCGDAEAGFFALCYATAQLLLTLGRFGMRTYQATDLAEKYSFQEYSYSRVLTVSLMLFGGLIYSGALFSGARLVTCFAIVMMKAADAVEDVYHGNLQQKMRVDLMGKSLAFRNLYSIVAFSACLILTKNLLLACVLTAVFSIGLCFILNHRLSVRYASPSDKDFRDKANNVKKLLITCFPLFLGTFFSLLLYNIPKYSLSAFMSEEYQTYYSILFMPSFVTTLLCEFILRPALAKIAGLWGAKDYHRFTRYFIRLFLVLLAGGICIVAGGDLVGRRILEIIYAADLSAYRFEFFILLCGGVLSALVYFLYNILIAIRHEKSILPVYGATILITWGISIPLVRDGGIQGASLCYFCSGAILFIVFLTILVRVILKERKSGEQGVSAP